MCLLGRLVLGGQEGADAFVATSALSQGGGDVGVVPRSTLGRLCGGRALAAARAADGSPVENSAEMRWRWTVAGLKPPPWSRGGGAAEVGGDGSGLVRQLPHPLAVAPPRRTVGSGLDQQAAFSSAASGRAEAGVVCGGERDRQRLLLPAGATGEHGQVPGGFCHRQEAPGSFRGLTCAVGCHPTQLLFIQLDEHARHEEIALPEQVEMLLLVVGAGECVSGTDQTRQADGEVGVAAGVEVGVYAGASSRGNCSGLCGWSFWPMPSIASRRRPTRSCPTGSSWAAAGPDAGGVRHRRPRRL